MNEGPAVTMSMAEARELAKLAEGIAAKFNVEWCDAAAVDHDRVADDVMLPDGGFYAVKRRRRVESEMQWWIVFAGSQREAIEWAVANS